MMKLYHTDSKKKMACEMFAVTEATENIYNLWQDFLHESKCKTIQWHLDLILGPKWLRNI